MNYFEGVVTSSTKSLQIQAQHLSQLTRDLARCCQSKEEQIFAKFNLSSSEGRVLLVMAEHEPTTASATAEELGLGRSRLTPLVDGLVHKGFLKRAESTSDRRVHTMTLTAAGRRVARQIINFQFTFHETLLRKINPSKREQLLNGMAQLRDAIEKLRRKIAS
jgi:DNA-binding MarR family transcriptional regulator